MLLDSDSKKGHIISDTSPDPVESIKEFFYRPRLTEEDKRAFCIELQQIFRWGEITVSSHDGKIRSIKINAAIRFS